jgi:DNA-directed RNA polymerase subunit omega
MVLVRNRFALVLLASQRTRQLMKGAPALVSSKNKAAVTSLREIAKSKVYYHREVREVVEQYIAEQKT